jgi:hypothetical protein
MSFRVLAWAQSIKTGSSSVKAVLLAIAAIVNDEGEGFPSQQRIADDSELSIRSVKRAMEELERAGVLTRERRYREGGYRTSDAIKLHMDVAFSGAKKSRDTESGDTVSNLRCHSGLAEPVIEPVSNTHTGRKRGKPTQFPDDFQLSPENFAVATSKGYTPDEIQTEIERMRNWSHNAHGAKGKKIDWQRFAFNWFTDSRKSKGRQNGTGFNQRSGINTIAGSLAAVDAVIDEIERREQAGREGYR